MGEASVARRRRLSFFRSLAQDAAGLEESALMGMPLLGLANSEKRFSNLAFPRFKRRPAVGEVAASFFAVLEVPRKGRFVLFPQVGDCSKRGQFAASAVG